MVYPNGLKSALVSQNRAILRKLRLEVYKPYSIRSVQAVGSLPAVEDRVLNMRYLHCLTKESLYSFILMRRLWGPEHLVDSMPEAYGRKRSHFCGILATEINVDRVNHLITKSFDSKHANSINWISKAFLHSIRRERETHFSPMKRAPLFASDSPKPRCFSMLQVKSFNASSPRKSESCFFAFITAFACLRSASSVS